MYIEREIKQLFNKATSAYNLVAVVGPRQAGKTTFLKQRISEVNGKYLMFDDPDVRAIFDEDIKKFETQYLQKGLITVLDEVQYGKDAGRKLKYLVDTGWKIWITSSSQVVLSSEVLSWLVGRISISHLFPFSFYEFMQAKGYKEIIDKISQKLVWEHIVYGGYPKVVLSEDVDVKRMILRDLYETMVLKDVSRTFSISDIDLLEKLSRYMAYSIGNTFVYHSVASDMKISFQSLKKCVSAMEKSHLISLVEPFSTNKLKELSKQPKIYFIDTGLRNSIANVFPMSFENEGKLFENYIYTELIKLGFNPKYWQTKGGAEVDFVVLRDNSLIPIEVKISIEDSIGKGLCSFISTYSPKTALVVCYKSNKKEVKVNGCNVIFTDIFGMCKLLTARAESISLKL